MTAPDSSASGWGSSVSLDDVCALLQRARRVVITTHAKPDGDAIGSVLALSRSLIHIGKAVECWLVGPIPRWTRNMTGPTPFRELAPGVPLKPVDNAPLVREPDAFVVVDTGSWSQIAEVRPALEGRSAQTIIVDHHLHGDAEIAMARFVQTSGASCTQVLAPLCASLVGVHNPARLPVDIAEPLYLGLATDTGWFRYSSVTPATLRLAADLVEAGVDHTKLYRLIEQQDLAGRWRLLGRALQSLEITPDGRVALMRLTRDDFAACQADPNDTGGFADMLLTVASVQVAIVLTEHAGAAGSPTPLVKLSFRSKPGPGAIDVNQVARTLGGGGHARAAGARVSGDLDSAAKQVLGALS